MINFKDSSISKTMYFETVISPVNAQGVDINYFEIPTEINVILPLKKIDPNSSQVAVTTL